MHRCVKSGAAECMAASITQGLCRFHCGLCAAACKRSGCGITETAASAEEMLVATRICVHMHMYGATDMRVY